MFYILTKYDVWNNIFKEVYLSLDEELLFETIPFFGFLSNDFFEKIYFFIVTWINSINNFNAFDKDYHAITNSVIYT
jgi:hypothetical protein